MRRLLAAAALVSSLACLWDEDTLREESLGKPDVLEVVTGKLRHHATAWYEAKIAYTQPMIDGGAAPKERYDDLAVALAKVGKLDDAIALLAQKEQRFPGEYTTEANLGTFDAMKGDRAAALDHLKKAIAINPDAHFGREKYQIELLDYAGGSGDFAGLPEPGVDLLYMSSPGHTFERHAAPSVPKDAVTAIVGLIRFGGNDRNGELWYSLGLALAWQGDKNLAIRALRRADVLGRKGAHEVIELVAEGTFPVEKAAEKHHQKLVEEAIAEADSDWAAGEKWEQAHEDAEVELARKHPKRAFGY